MIQVDIPSHVGVEAYYDLNVLTFPDLIEITFFDFGNIPIGQSNTTNIFIVRNVGNDNLWCAWTVTNLPVGFSIELQELDSGAYIPQDTYDALPVVTPGENWGGGANGRFWLILTNDAASSGSFDFTISFLGADSATG